MISLKIQNYIIVSRYNIILPYNADLKRKRKIRKMSCFQSPNVFQILQLINTFTYGSLGLKIFI